MSRQDHVILNHVDSPLKILFWTKGEILLFMIPFMVGLLTDMFMVGCGFSLLNSWLVAKYKRYFGKGHLQALMYWYLPSKHLGGFVPSHIRLYLY